MTWDQIQIKWEKTLNLSTRLIVLNPCLLLSLMAAAWIFFFQSPILPEKNFDSEKTVRITGWIASFPEEREDHIHFNLAPIELKQGSRIFEINGKIAVAVSSSIIQPRDYFQPRLRWGEVLYFSAYLMDHQYNAVPGTLDRRILSRLKGVPYRVNLKSPEIVTRMGQHEKIKCLSPIFLYFHRFLDACFEKLSPSSYRLVCSLLLGRNAYLPDEIRSRINRMGISHLFAVSGFHIGIIAFSIFFLTRFLDKAGALITILVVWSYILALGFPISAIRAGLIFSLGLMGFQFGLKASLNNLIGASALGLLSYSSSSLYLPSFHFSFGCVLGISLLALPITEKLNQIRRSFEDILGNKIVTGTCPEHRIYRRIRYSAEQFFGFFPIPFAIRVTKLVCPPVFYITAILCVTVSIHVFLFPILIFYTNNWSFSYLFSNLLFIPLFGILIVLNLVVFFIYWSPFGPPIFLLLDSVCFLILQIVEKLCPDSDSFHLPQPNSTEFLMFYAVIAISFTVTLKWAWILRLLGICGILFSLQLDEEKNPNDLEITMLDMGQAECIHIRYPMGKNGLIDAGSPAFPSYLIPISERVISRYLWDQRVRKLEFILLTHPETDHMSAFTFLSNVFQPNSVLFSRYHPAYGNALETLKAGETFWIGGVRHWIPHPDSTRAEKLKVNDSSVVVEIRYGRFSALFTGDITVEIERKLVDKLRPVILLKVPHHGSDSSSSKFLLDTIRPKMAWISAGRRNPFGHPHLNVLKRLSERGTQILTTPEQGSLRLRTDGIHLRVQHYQSVTGGFIDLFQEKLPLMD